MYPYMNEDVAWQRLVDAQREMDNSRLWATRTSNLLELAVQLLTGAFVAVSPARRRRPRMLDTAEADEAMASPDAA
jgi:hypothetical protein